MIVNQKPFQHIKNKTNYRKIFIIVCLSIVSILFGYLFSIFMNYAISDINRNINFVYVNDQTVYLGDEQKVLVSLNDYNDKNNYYLHYSNCDDVFSCSPSDIKDNSLLFSIPFEADSKIGAYSLDDLSWNGDTCGKEEIPVNDDYGFTFSVTTNNDKTSDAFANATIYSITDDGEINEENSIDDAISKTKTSLISENSNNSYQGGTLRIALDPGHGGSDPGACRYGLVESYLNLEIAKACYNELKLYKGVAPYLVRDTDEYVDLRDRVLRARDIGHCNVFVSFHINSSTSTSAGGFEIYVQNSSSWHYELHQESWELGDQISHELAKFGFYYRGTKEWNHPNESYPDGSVADYLAVLRHSRYTDISAILIEHLFISNPTEASFLSNIENQWALGRADATGIAKKYNLSKETYENINGTFIISPVEDTSKAIDVKDSSLADFGNVQINNKQDCDSQKWKVITDSSTGDATFINVNSGKALDLYCGKAISGQNIDQYSINYSAGETWKIVKDKDGISYKIENKVDQDYVVDICGGSYAPGTNIWLYSSNDSRPQRYVFTQVDDPEEYEVINGEFSIGSVINPNIVFDVSGGSLDAGANVQVYQSNNTFAQKWKITTDASTKFATIENINSHKVLDIYGGRDKVGTNVWQYNSNGSLAQKWKIVKYGENYCFVSAINPNICLGLSSLSVGNCTNIRTNYYFNTKDNLFSLYDLHPNVEKGKDISDGEYFIASAKVSSKVVDLPLESYNYCGSKYQIWDKNQSIIDNQVFIFERISEGIFYIKNKKSGKVLDVDNGCVVPGTKLSQWDKYGSDNQKWVIQDVDSNNCRIVNVASGLCLHLASEQAGDGSSLDVYCNRNNLSDIWIIQKAEKPEPVITGNYVLASKLNGKKVIEIYGGHLEDGAAAEIYDYNNSIAQKWEISTSEKSGLSTIKNMNSNKVLDVLGDDVVSGAKLCQNSIDIDRQSQKWKMVKVGDYFKFLSAVDNTLAIDIPDGVLTNFTQIQLFEDKGLDEQLFSTVKYDPVVPPTPCDLTNGDYFIKFAKNTNKVIDLDMNTESIDGGKLQVYAKNTSNKFYNQIFTVTKLNDGYYRIENKCSKKSFDLDNGCPMPGTIVHQWGSGDTNNQKWAVEKIGDSYLFTNAASGLCLSTNGFSDSDGTNLCGQIKQSSPSTMWKFVKWNPEYTPIMHDPTRTSDQMAALFNSYGKTYPAIYASKGAPTIKSFCDLCVQEAVYEGVDPTILFAQAMHETGWLQFGGDVLPEQCNFGGLGATGGGVHGATFDNVQQGLCAQVQHLKCYASTAPLVNPTIYDPRWQAVIDKWGRGCAPNLEDLNGKWAVPGMWYAQSIINIIERIV